MKLLNFIGTYNSSTAQTDGVYSIHSEQPWYDVLKIWNRKYICITSQHGHQAIIKPAKRILKFPITGNILNNISTQ